MARVEEGNNFSQFVSLIEWMNGCFTAMVSETNYLGSLPVQTSKVNGKPSERRKAHNTHTHILQVINLMHLVMVGWPNMYYMRSWAAHTIHNRHIIWIIMPHRKEQIELNESKRWETERDQRMKERLKQKKWDTAGNCEIQPEYTILHWSDTERMYVCIWQCWVSQTLTNLDITNWRITNSNAIFRRN